MNFEKVKKYSFIFPCIGAICFLLFTFIAMLLYSGGSQYYPNDPGYSFSQNYFSDLGMRTSYSNNSNIISSLLFLFATIFMGLSMIPYFLVFPTLFTKKSWQQILTIFGSLLGLISAIAYIGIGFTPWDLYLTAHMYFVYIAFPLTLPTILVYIMASLNSKEMPKLISMIYILLTLILAGYLYLLFFGPSGSEVARLIQVIGQKIIVYAEVLTFFAQGFILYKHHKKNNQPSDISAL